MNQLRVGHAKCDITPKIGCYLQGNTNTRITEKVHDPLHVRCVMFENEGTAILLYYDLVGIKQGLSEGIREFVAEAIGCQREDVFVSCTHTHTGPNVNNAAFPKDEAYIESLKHISAQAARMAKNDLHPAELFFARDTLDGLNFCRRYRMKDGSVRTNPGTNNPEILEPMNDGDNVIQLLKITREGAGDIALVNFQCHADVVKKIDGVHSVSADYPGAVCDTLEGAIPGLSCVYCNGPNGDLVQGDQMHQPEWDNRRCWNHALHMGRTIAGKILGMYTKARPIEAGVVKTTEKVMDLPLKQPTAEQIESAKKVLEAYEKGEFVIRSQNPYTMEDTTTLYEARVNVGLSKMTEKAQARVSAFSVGDFAVAGIPGEPFSEIGKRIRNATPFAAQFSLCLTNGCEGYFPMEDAFGVDGYESRTTKFRAGIGETMADTALELLNALKNK